MPLDAGGKTHLVQHRIGDNKGFVPGQFFQIAQRIFPMHNFGTVKKPHNSKFRFYMGRTAHQFLGSLDVFHDLDQIAIQLDLARDYALHGV